MNILGILALEQSTPPRIYLHRDGDYWKLHQQSAYRFWQLYSKSGFSAPGGSSPAYRFQLQWMRDLHTSVAVVLIPAGDLDLWFAPGSLQPRGENCRYLDGQEAVAEADFDYWSSGLTVMKYKIDPAAWYTGTSREYPERIYHYNWLKRQLEAFDIGKAKPEACEDLIRSMQEYVRKH